MEKEAQKPQIAPPRIGNIGEVLRELRGNQAHLTTPKVHLTKEKYTPSEAMAKVENIATLKQVMMDKDFLERCQNIEGLDFYISSKDIPREIIDALASLYASDPFLYFKIDREEGTLNLLSESQYDGLSPTERGSLHRSVLRGIKEGGLLCISSSDTVWWVGDPSFLVSKVSLPIAVVESTD